MSWTLFFFTPLTHTPFLATNFINTSFSFFKGKKDKKKIIFKLLKKECK